MMCQQQDPYLQSFWMRTWGNDNAKTKVGHRGNLNTGQPDLPCAPVWSCKINMGLVRKSLPQFRRELRNAASPALWNPVPFKGQLANRNRTQTVWFLLQLGITTANFSADLSGLQSTSFLVKYVKWPNRFDIKMPIVKPRTAIFSNVVSWRTFGKFSGTCALAHAMRKCFKKGWF